MDELPEEDWSGRSLVDVSSSLKQRSKEGKGALPTPARMAQSQPRVAKHDL